jgi:hypothetical protein
MSVDHPEPSGLRSAAKRGRFFRDHLARVRGWVAQSVDLLVSKCKSRLAKLGRLADAGARCAQHPFGRPQMRSSCWLTAGALRCLKGGEGFAAPYYFTGSSARSERQRRNSRGERVSLETFLVQSVNKSLVEVRLAHQTPNNSTSNTSVAFGGITPPAPRAP